MFLNLLGIQAGSMYQDETAYILTRCYMAMFVAGRAKSLTAEQVGGLLQLTRPRNRVEAINLERSLALLGADLPDPGAARATIAGFLADGIDRLETILEDHEANAAIEAREDAAIALVDTSKQGQLRARYRAEHERSLHRNYGDFIKLRKLREAEIKELEKKEIKAVTGSIWHDVLKELHAELNELNDPDDRDESSESSSESAPTSESASDEQPRASAESGSSAGSSDPAPAAAGSASSPVPAAPAPNEPRSPWRGRADIAGIGTPEPPTILPIASADPPR
jgi:hypothetical protein